MKKYVKLIAIIICISLVLVGLSACTTNANYFTFEPNSDETGYIITGTAKILPEKVTLPNKYQCKPVVKATIESKSVKKLTIPSNIEELSLNCKSLASIKIANENTHFKLQDEVLYEYNITRIVLVLPTKQGDYAIPRTIITAERWAFRYANIDSIYVPIEYVNNCSKYGYEVQYSEIMFDMGRMAPFSPIALYDNEITVNFESTQENEWLKDILIYKADNALVNWGIDYQS